MEVSLTTKVKGSKKDCALNNRGGAVLHEVLWFMAVPPWILDGFVSGIADIHMSTDAKNLVTTARTIHLPEQKETIHMISIVRKAACSGSIHDLAHISTQNCLADCLTKASAKTTT